MAPTAHSSVQLENEHFRVTEWTIPQGATIPLHRHDYEYVVIPLVTASMRVDNADGSSFDAELVTGVSYSRPAGSEHAISNVSSPDAIVFVEVEKL
ncbi:cupin domain-containing protein [Leucobacter sp. BZR 635]